MDTLLKPKMLDVEEQNVPSSHSKPSTRRSFLNVIIVLCIGAIIMCAVRMVPSQAHLTAHTTALVTDVQQMLSTLAPYQMMQVAEGNRTAQQLLRSVHCFDAFVVATAGVSRPSRRAENQPFLVAESNILQPGTVVAINRAASAVESVLGRRLFPMKIRVADFSHHLPPSPSVVRPYAIWEASTGTILVDRQLGSETWKQSQVDIMMRLLADKLWGTLASAIKQAKSAVSTPASVVNLLGPALLTAIPAAFAAAPALWFCIACPVVLGLLAPLVINIGLGQVAGLLCTQMQLPDDQCYDLLLGALGLGFVLSLASAIPIFYVCRLYECAHPGGDVPPAAPTWRMPRLLWKSL